MNMLPLIDRMTLMTFRMALLAVLSAAMAGQEVHSNTCNDIGGFTNDPNLATERISIPHAPQYATYSKWQVNGVQYVLAYRNKDKRDPYDNVVDIYQGTDRPDHFRKLITVPIFQKLEAVKLVNVTPEPVSQLAFFSVSGELEFLRIVGLRNGSARLLFDYGATSIKLAEDKSGITAYAKTSNTTENFIWCDAVQGIVLEQKCGHRKH